MIQTVILAIPVLVPGLVSATQRVRVVRYDSSVGVGYNKVGIEKFRKAGICSTKLNCQAQLQLQLQLS